MNSNVNDNSHLHDGVMYDDLTTRAARDAWFSKKESAAVLNPIVNKLNPRNYRVPNNFSTPKLVAEIIALDLITHSFLESKGYLNDSTDQRAQYKIDSCVAQKLLTHNVPTFFVSKNLLDALDETDLPEFDLWGIDWPFDSFLLMIPHDTVFYRDNGVEAIVLTKIRDGEKFNDSVGKPSQVGVDLIVFTPIRGLDSEYAQSISSSAVRPNAGEECTTSNILKAFSKFSENPIYKTPQPVRIAMCVLLAMLARPEIIGKEVVFKSASSKPSGVSLKGDYGPNWIGQNYPDRKTESVGGHDSPRWHWRRGHYRIYKKEKGWKLDKVIWIEPCFVAPGSEDEEK